jgi:AcrR family transcriptional regulator
MFGGDDAAARLVGAATAAIVERGYPAATVGEIAERASASLSTFYEHFDGKEDVFVAALEAGQAQMFEATLPAFQEAQEWPAAVRGAFAAMTDFLAEQPSFARLAIVEIFSGTTRALERRDRTIEGLQAVLVPGYERAPATPAIAAEAIGGATYELVYRQVRSGGAESLPRAAPLMTYVALAPFLGADEACAVANGGG